MKILLLTQLFQPEPNHLKGLAFAKELRERGHECEVLTAFPNYPLGKLYPGYRMRAWARGEMDGIGVTRCAVFPSHDASSVRRMLTYASFALTATVVGLILYRGSRFDIVHVYQGPATLMLPGKILAWLTKAKLVLDVQDLWPDSVVSSDMTNSGALIRAIAWWTRWTYRTADRIIVLSNGYKSRIVQTGIDPDKISVIYNWCDESGSAADEPIPDDLSRLKQEGKSIVLYAGTMGRVQALQSVLDAAALLEREYSDIHFAFVGSGVEAGQLRQYAAQKNLSNVSFFPRAEAPLMHAIINGADALLIHLKKDGLGSIGIPQKTQAFLAAGKPVVMAANGEAGQIMKASNAAVCCEPEDPEQIANAVKHIFMKTREEREAMGANGARFYREVMSFAMGITSVIGTYIQARSGRRGEALASPPVQRSGPLPEVAIRAAREEDLPGIVGVHMESFRNFFLTFLGPRFLALLYTEIMKEKGSVTLVAIEPGERVIGFAIGVRDQANLYRRLAMQRWYAFAAASLRTALAHPSIIPRLFQAFTYVGKAKGTACPALLMSIAVSEEGQGRGLGKELTEGFLCAMAENGVDMVCLTTDRDRNESVNAFYRKMGFILAKEYQTRQGRWMNEYVISTKRGRV